MEQVLSLLLRLPPKAWKKLSWRQGEKRKLASRFAWLRVRPAHRDYEQHEANREQWLLIEWPRGEAEPTKYWLSNLPPASAQFRPRGAVRSPSAALPPAGEIAQPQFVLYCGLVDIMVDRDYRRKGIGLLA